MEKDTIHIHQRSLVVQTVMARVPSDVASVMVRVPELVADVTVLEGRDSFSRVYTKRT